MFCIILYTNKGYFPALHWQLACDYGAVWGKFSSAVHGKPSILGLEARSTFQIGHLLVISEEISKFKFNDDIIYLTQTASNDTHMLDII